MARRRTRSEAEMEARLDQLDPSSPRYRVLAAARDFKAAWVELGEQLTLVREQGTWSAWGYTSFEAYCRRELRIKNETANKLTRSFAFMRDHEPVVLESRAQRELPPLDVVDLLSQARERTRVSDADLHTIREEVFSPEASPTKTQVVRRFREIDPDAFRTAPKAPAKGEGDRDLRKALLLAERLQTLLDAVPDVSRDSIKGVRTAVAELRERFEASRAVAAEAEEAAEQQSA